MQSFETLPYQEQLHRLQHLVERVLPFYNLHEAQYALLQYEDNAVYHVANDAGEHFVLRISALKGHSVAAQRSEMWWLMALKYETDLSVPEPIPTRDGALVTTISIMEVLEPRHCVLLRWVPGEPPTSGIQPEVVERIGVFTAQLHQYAERFVFQPEFVRPSWDWEHLFGASSVLGCEEAMAILTTDQQDILSTVSIQIQQTLGLPGKEAPMWGLIHADLHRDNILLHYGEVGVIDFDDCGWGYYLFDLASVLDSFSRRIVSTHKDYLLLREAYLKGYDRIRALPAGLDSYLRAAKVMRDMSVVNFILTSKNASVQMWGQQRVDQIIVQMAAYLEGSSTIEI